MQPLSMRISVSTTIERISTPPLLLSDGSNPSCTVPHFRAIAPHPHKGEMVKLQPLRRANLLLLLLQRRHQIEYLLAVGNGERNEIAF